MRICCAAVGVTWLWTAVSAQAPQPIKRVDLLAFLQAGYAGNKANLIAAAEAIYLLDAFARRGRT